MPSPKPATDVSSSPRPATPLPWKVDGPDEGLITAVSPLFVAHCHMGQDRASTSYPSSAGGRKNAAYIVHACNAFPALEAERDAIKERVRELEEGLRNLNMAYTKLFFECLMGNPTPDEEVYLATSRLMAKTNRKDA